MISSNKDAGLLFFKFQQVINYAFGIGSAINIIADKDEFAIPVIGQFLDQGLDRFGTTVYITNGYEFLV